MHSSNISTVLLQNAWYTKEKDNTKTVKGIVIKCIQSKYLYMEPMTCKRLALLSNYRLMASDDEFGYCKTICRGDTLAARCTQQICAHAHHRKWLTSRQ